MDSIFKSIFKFKLNDKVILEFREFTMYDHMWVSEHFKSLANLFYILRQIPHPETGEMINEVDEDAFLRVSAHMLSDDSKAIISSIKSSGDTDAITLAKLLTKKNAGEMATSFFAMINSSLISDEDQKKTQDANAMRMLES